VTLIAVGDLAMPPILLAIILSGLLAGLISLPENNWTAETNSPPTAVNDSYNVHGGTTIGPFMANDSDPDGNPISFNSIVTFPAHGTIYGLQQADMKLFAPASGYTGADSFTYKICDNLGSCSTATVNLNIYNNTPGGGHRRLRHPWGH
jgi:hypothetical protein